MRDVSKFGMCATSLEGFAVHQDHPVHTLQVMEVSKVGDEDFFTQPFAEGVGITISDAKNALEVDLMRRGWTQQNVIDFFASPQRMKL